MLKMKGQKYNNEPDLRIAAVEEKLITVALGRSAGHRGDAAERLGISVRSLKLRIKQRRSNDEKVNL